MKELRLLTVVAVICVSFAADASARVFTDKKGNQVNADFVRMQNGMVPLKPANKYAQATAFPFYDFCEADQQWLRMALEKRGQADQIPPPPPQKDEPETPQTPAHRLPPQFVPPSFAPPTAPKSSTTGIGERSTSPTVESRTAESSAVGSQAANNSSPLSTATSAPSATFRQATPASPTISTPRQPRFAPTHEFFCGECQRAIPIEQLGFVNSASKCPLCGVKWDEFKTVVSGNTTTYHGRTFWDNYGWRMIRYGIIIVGLIVGGIVKQSRKR